MATSDREIPSCAVFVTKIGEGRRAYSKKARKPGLNLCSYLVGASGFRGAERRVAYLKDVADRVDRFLADQKPMS